MEQYIDIKYINNLINLGFSDINSYPNFQFKENLLNINFPKDKDNTLNQKFKDNSNSEKEKEIAKIRQIENIRNRIFILLDNFTIQKVNNSDFILYKSSSILSYDIKTEAMNLKIFENKKVDDYIKLFIIEDEIYSILGSKILCIDHKNLEIVREWEIGEKFYYFCIYETSQILKMNLDIFYVNFENELKFFGKCLLFDIKQKTLYKEQNIIDKIIFHEDLLMWSSNFTIKIFDLKNKQMILRKNYDEVREEIFKNQIKEYESILNKEYNIYSYDRNELNESQEKSSTTNIINKCILAEKFKTINFFITNDLLSLNVGNKIIHILKIEKLKPLPNDNFLGLNIGFNLSNISPTGTQKSAKLYKVYDLFAFKTTHNSKFLGYWINSSQNKLSIVKVINPREKNFKHLELNIIKIDKNEGSSEFLLKKSFDKIITSNCFQYSYSEKYANFFIFDDSEIYNFSLIDKEERVLSELKNNYLNGVNSFNLIYDNFNKFDFSQRVFIVFKTLRNYDKLGIDIENISENKKLIYMIDSIINNIDNCKKHECLQNPYLENAKIKNHDKENENEDELDKNYRSIHFENLIHIFNIFINNKKFYYIYKIFKKYLKKFFNYIDISKHISKGIANDVMTEIHSQSRYDYMIEKKVMKILDRIIIFCITRVLKKTNYLSHNVENGSGFNSSKETYDKQIENSKNPSKEIPKQDNISNENQNLEILDDILKFKFSLQHNDFSLSTINLILKIYFSKIKIFTDKINNGKNSIKFEDDLEGDDIFIDENSFDEDIRKDINTNFYASLLNYSLLSKLFMKMKDYNRAIRSLIYNNSFDEIFELIKHKKIPLESIENELKIIIGNFTSEKIMQLIDFLYNENYPMTKNNTFDLERFLNLLLDINMNKFDPNNSKESNKVYIDKSDLAFDFFDVLNNILDNEKIQYFNEEFTAERYLFYIFNYLIHLAQIIDNSSEDIFRNQKSEEVEKNLNVTKKYIIAYNKFDHKKILDEYKKKLYDNKILNPLLITIYEISKDYKPIIDIQIDILRDPEISIRFIDSLDIFHDKKEELFEYLRNKIIKSEFLTPIKKFYFINLFEDGDEEEDKKTLINQIYEVKDEEDKKYILLILEQFRLKLKILQISKSLASENLSRLNKAFKKMSFKGVSRLNIINNDKLKLKCEYRFCKEKEIKRGDLIKIFFNCKHLFHKKCIDVYISKVALFSNKPNPSIVDIDKIEEFENIYNTNILLNLERDNSEDVSDCIVCSQYDI